MGYSLRMFGAMQADEIRIGGYRAALGAALTPGDSVVDIGAGPGIMTLLACRLGAGRVDAIEIDDAIHLARQLAADNGYADRVHCWQAMSTAVELPQRADVVVADLRAVLPLHGVGVPSLIDARNRFLADGGHLIPARDWLMGGVVTAPRDYAHLVGPWEDRPMGLTLAAGRALAVQHWQRVTLPPGALLSDVQTLAELDYGALATPDLSATASWRVGVPGTAHGVALWFHTELWPGIGYATGPDATPTVYGQAFFPWPQPLAVEPGARVDLELRADLIDGDYTWTWRSRVHAADGGDVRFDQSTFGARPLSAGIVRSRTADARPALSPAGQRTDLVLSLMDGRHTLAEIARVVCEQQDGLTHAEALRRVADIAERYGTTAAP